MISVIAQKLDIYPEDGKHPFARTGELSLFHLKKAGATGTLIGHSEVGESAAAVKQKLTAAWDAGLTHNIVLFGDQWEDLGKPWSELDEVHQARVIEIVREKFLAISQGIPAQCIEKTVFAYEPAWSVSGSGRSSVPLASVDQIERIASVLRNTLKDSYGVAAAKNTRIVYGGSMSPARTKEIMAIAEIDGFGAGHDSTKTLWVKEMAAGMAGVKKDRRAVFFLNWKAYELKEPYEAFVEILQPFSKSMDIYLAPPATDIAMLAQLV